MENPFNLSREKLSEIMAGFISWLNSNPQEAKYPDEFRSQAENIRNDFLNYEVITNMSDEDFYNKIYKYSRSLEGPVHIRLGESRIRNNLDNLRRNLKYIISSKDSPFTIAQNILDGEYKIEVFAKAFWSPILHARFSGILPNWNNKTERLLRKLGVNLSTLKLSISEKYEALSNSFKFLSSLAEGQDFYNINHLMHYGTEIKEGKDLIDKLQGSKVFDPIIAMIGMYKELIKQTGLKDEIYKWELLSKYRGRPDLEAADFSTEIKNIDLKNLMYPMAIAVRNHIADELPAEFRECFVKLFNDDEDLTSRVKGFMDNVLTVYRKLEPKLGHHHDERTIASYLAYHKPDKYAFYKDSFYQKYCKLINTASKPKGEKYSHYMELIADFRDEYILPDAELIELVGSFMTPDCFEDENHLVMAQDILFQMLDKGEEIIDITTESVFKISMGEFSDKEYKDAVSNKAVLVHKDTKAKGTSSITQGDVFQYSIKEGDYFYLTHGNKGSSLLGQFVGNVRPAQNKEMASSGWIERSFVEVMPSINQSAYKGKKKWWTPNENSTCIEIPLSELEEANKLIFKPYFNAVFNSDTLSVKNKSSDTPDNNLTTMSNPLNTILYGPPGTGKTYHTIDFAVKIAAPEKYVKGDHKANKKTYDDLVEQGQIVFTIFHQSMCYEDFIEGIKPLNPGDNDTYLKYDIEDGILKKVCSAAVTPNQVDFNTAFKDLHKELTEKEIIDLYTPTGKAYSISLNRNGNLNLHTGESKKIQGTLTKENIQKQIGGDDVFDYWHGYFKGVIDRLKSEHGYNPEEIKTEQNFVLIIDEINRGNVAEIFGELITLIEEDKRQGKDEVIKVTLPYSKKEFSVPSNLYIIGTMNTADRSVEALDTALRRRFSFVEMMPEYEFPELNIKIAGIKLSSLLKTINQRIEKLLDRDHQIGHSYFLKVNNDVDLQQVFKDKIIPLLQEYFYGDYEKLGLVLGMGFVKPIIGEDKLFAKFSVEDLDIYEKSIYHFNQDPLNNIPEFKTAINNLMNIRITDSEE